MIISQYPYTGTIYYTGTKDVDAMRVQALREKGNAVNNVKYR
jgi:hypothetical protein